MAYSPNMLTADMYYGPLDGHRCPVPLRSGAPPEWIEWSLAGGPSYRYVRRRTTRAGQIVWIYLCEGEF